jgi:hypothetical protein
LLALLRQQLAGRGGTNRDDCSWLRLTSRSTQDHTGAKGVAHVNKFTIRSPALLQGLARYSHHRLFKAKVFLKREARVLGFPEAVKIRSEYGQSGAL